MNVGTAHGGIPIDRSVAQVLRRGWRQHRFPYLLLAPTLLILLAFLVIPFGSLFYLGFRETPLAGGSFFVGFDNFVALFGETRFIGNLSNSLIYLVGCLALSVPAAYFTAWLVMSGIKGAGMLRTALLIPWILAPVVTALLFRTLLNPVGGPVIEFLAWIYGEPVYPTLTAAGSMGVVIIHAAWRSFPLMMLMLVAAMTSISTEMYEAAKVDGATRWQQFWYITVPLTRPALLSSVIVISIFTLHDAESIFALTRGGPGFATEVIGIRLFKEAFISFNIGQASSIGMLLVGLSIVVIFLIFWLLGSRTKG